MNKGRWKLITSFRNKMIFIFFLMTIIPFLLFAYYANLKSVEGITKANSAFSMDYLVQSKKNFDQYLNRVNDQVNDVIGNPDLQQLMAQVPKTSEEEIAFSSAMLNFSYTHMRYVDAFQVRVFPVSPADYPVYMSSRMLNVSDHLETQSWFQRSIHSVTPTWHLLRPEENQNSKPTLAYIKRFTSLYDQTPRGIIVTDLTDDQLNRYLAPTKRLQEQRSYLINSEGIVLYDSTDRKSIGLPIASKELHAQILTRTEGTATLSIEGKTQLVTFVQLSAEPWFLVSTIPLEQLTGSIQETQKLLIFFLVIYLLCCIGVIIYITLYFTNPLMWLVKFMRKLENGEFSYILPHSTRKDEIGWLYRGFNNMSQKIEGLIEQAYRSERTKKDLEFQVLSHQINPHFLYNTLESIRWKAEYHDMKDISEMVSSLGNLLRLSLNQGEEITTLGREFEHVKAYVNIEQARLGKPMRILYFMDKDLQDTPFLRLLLQPLVENAIHHGIRGNFDNGKIILSARKQDRDIMVELTDNGEGINPSVIEQLESPDLSSKKRHGVGLRNVNERLKLYFGDDYKLQVETGHGTKITLRHPIIRDLERQKDSSELKGESSL